MARETALSRVRGVRSADAESRDRFRALLARALRYAEQWHTDDEHQMAEIEVLRGEQVWRRLVEWRLPPVGLYQLLIAHSYTSYS